MAKIPNIREEVVLNGDPSGAKNVRLTNVDQSQQLIDVALRALKGYSDLSRGDDVSTALQFLKQGKLSLNQASSGNLVSKQEAVDVGNLNHILGRLSRSEEKLDDTITTLVDYIKRRPTQTQGPQEGSLGRQALGDVGGGLLHAGIIGAIPGLAGPLAPLAVGLYSLLHEGISTYRTFKKFDDLSKEEKGKEYDVSEKRLPSHLREVQADSGTRNTNIEEGEIGDYGDLDSLSDILGEIKASLDKESDKTETWRNQTVSEWHDKLLENLERLFERYSAGGDGVVGDPTVESMLSDADDKPGFVGEGGGYEKGEETKDIEGDIEGIKETLEEEAKNTEVWRNQTVPEWHDRLIETLERIFGKGSESSSGRGDGSPLFSGLTGSLSGLLPVLTKFGVILGIVAGSLYDAHEALEAFRELGNFEHAKKSLYDEVPRLAAPEKIDVNKIIGNVRTDEDVAKLKSSGYITDEDERNIRKAAGIDKIPLHEEARRYIEAKGVHRPDAETKGVVDLRRKDMSEALFPFAPIGLKPKGDTIHPATVSHPREPINVRAEDKSGAHITPSDTIRTPSSYSYSSVDAKRHDDMMLHLKHIHDELKRVSETGIGSKGGTEYPVGGIPNLDRWPLEPDDIWLALMNGGWI